MSVTLEAGCVGLSQVSRVIEMFVVGDKSRRDIDISERHGYSSVKLASA